MLRISVGPSHLLAAIMVVAHAAAIALVLSVDLPLWMILGATALLCVQATIVVWRQALLRGQGAATAIEITSDHKLNLETRAGGWREYDVLGSTYVTPCLTILNLREPGNRRTRRIALLPDSLHAEDFRKLRVWLRWKEDNAESEGAAKR